MKVKISGFIDLSLIDVLFFPSCVAYFSGCNFRCPWCQNYEVAEGKGDFVDINFIVDKVKENFLVDFFQASGGEPTLQEKALIDLFFETKKYKKNSLNTNGSNPEVVKKVLDEELIDHIAIDFKAPPEKYESLVGINFDFKCFEKTLKLISDFDFIEIRTTFVYPLLKREDLFEIVDILLTIFKEGSFFYVVQKFYCDNVRNCEGFEEVSTDFLRSLCRDLAKRKSIKVFLRSKEGVEVFG